MLCYKIVNQELLVTNVFSDVNLMRKTGSLIISLDFELAWGIIEKSYLKEYCKTNVCNVPIVVEKMLELFDKYQVNVTIATVGFLMCKDKKELEKYSPDLKPSYTNKALSPYAGFLETIEQDAPCYFFPSIMKCLKKKNNVEIASHTFCHYYCWEAGQTISQFEEDIKAARRIAEDKGIVLKSIVFPRNNVSDEYLKICKQQGVLSYRGNTRKFFDKPKNKIEWYKNRLSRLIDSYIAISGHNTYNMDEVIVSDELPINLPASRLFRPYSNRMAILEPLRINRIKQEIKYAAKNGEMYHLWWHPHNFGADIDKNMKNLESVLRYYAECHKKYGMQSYTMSEFADMIISKK